MANRIEMSDATKKGIALAIGALCVCVVGAMLAVGRGSGSRRYLPERPFGPGGARGFDGSPADGTF